MTPRWAMAALSGSLLGCSGSAQVEHVSAAERGQALFESALDVNFSCASCHTTRDAESATLKPGADLRGVASRATFWGGQENDLLRSLNACRTRFQEAEPFSADEPPAADLYAFLASLDGPPDAVPFTVVGAVQDLEPGDAERGTELYGRACQGCHGTLAEGSGSLADAPVLPDDVLRGHSHYTGTEQRLVFIEKVRHGGFLGYSGAMPPFSLEALSDAQLGDLLRALELYAP